METTAPFELAALRRDWIGELTGEAFHRQVLAARTQLAPLPDPLIIRAEDPIAFAASFFAGVALRRPVALANPHWGAQERQQFDRLMGQRAPAAGSILIPTGGTTGGVKLAIHDWGSLCASARAAQALLGGGAVHACCVLPLHHVSGLMQLLRAFVSGGTVRFDENETAGRCLSLVPTQLQRWMQTAAGIGKMTAARVVFVGGAAMPEPVRQQARALRLPVVPVYGMTETAAMIAAIPNDDFLAAPNPGAVLLGDTQLSIDPDGAIRVRGSSLFKGYHGGMCIDPRQGFRTGDAGWLDGQGRLHLHGRMDALINTGGEKVDPAEVQHALLQLPGVTQANVVGEPNEEWGQVVVAYLQITPTAAPLSEVDLQRALKQQLSPYKIPKYIRCY
jgi:O-succinylbenzoic acid--CoA ligase